MSRRRRDFGVIITEGTPTHPAFSIRWWEGGRWRRQRGFPTRTAATAKLAVIRTALSDGVLDAHRRAEIPLATVADEWLRNHSAVRLRSHKDNVERWRRIEKFFGAGMVLSQITTSRVLEFRERLQAGGLKAGTINRHLALLRSVLNFAVAAGYLQVSPLRRFQRGTYLLPDPRPKRAPPLANAAEAVRLLTCIRAAAPEWFALLAFLLYIGARKGEAAGIEWADVDLTRRVLTIRRSYKTPPKSGKPRTVPVTAELVPILVEHRARDPWGGSLVFPYPTTGKMMSPDARTPQVVLRTACKAAGVPPMRLHDLRHAHAGLFLMAGGSLTDVQRNLGHSTPVLTSETYGHIAEDHRLREADRRLEFGLGEPTRWPAPTEQAEKPGAGGR